MNYKFRFRMAWASLLTCVVFVLAARTSDIASNQIEPDYIPRTFEYSVAPREVAQVDSLQQVEERSALRYQVSTYNLSEAINWFEIFFAMVATLLMVLAIAFFIGASRDANEYVALSRSDGQQLPSERPLPKTRDQWLFWLTIVGVVLALLTYVQSLF